MKDYPKPGVCRLGLVLSFVSSSNVNEQIYAKYVTLTTLTTVFHWGLIIAVVGLKGDMRRTRTTSLNSQVTEFCVYTARGHNLKFS